MSQTRANVVRVATRLVPPLIVFAVARSVLALAAWGAGVKSTRASSWCRWDSGHYLSVAQNGYEFFSCARLAGYNPADWCGNAAWLPGYPLLIRALSVADLTQEQSGVLISAGFTLAGLTLLWNAFLGPETSARGLLALLLAAVFPGHVYYAAVFPIAMCTFFSMLAIKLYDTKQFLLAGVAGGLAAFSYSTGFFLAFVFGLHLLRFHRRDGFGSLAAKVLLASGLTFSGFLA